MNNNSGFGDINNCNSLNSSVASSPTANSIRMNSFYKLTNVLLLLFLVFGSSVVSFGMNTKHLDDENNEEKEKQQDENKAQESILHALKKVYCMLSLKFLYKKTSMNRITTTTQNKKSIH